MITLDDAAVSPLAAAEVPLPLPLGVAQFPEQGTQVGSPPLMVDWLSLPMRYTGQSSV